MTTSSYWYIAYAPGVSGGTYVRSAEAAENRDLLASVTPTVQRPLIGYPIRSDAATYSGGDYETTLPLDNVKNLFKSKKARSTDATTTNTQLDIDLGATYPIGIVVLDGHNLSSAALVRVRGSDESDVNPAVYDSGWVAAYREAIPSGILQPGEDGYLDGLLTAAQISDLTASGRSVPHIQFVPAEVEAHYWRVEINDTGNSDGYVQLGRVILAPTFQPSINFVVGSQEALGTSSSRHEADGGTFHVMTRHRRRRMTGQIRQITQDEAYVRLQDTMQLAGTTGLLFFCKDPTATLHLHRFSFQGYFDTLDPLSEPYVTGRRAQGLAILEAL